VRLGEKCNIKQNVKSGRIGRIGVLEPYRPKGIGTRLVLQGLKTLKTKSMVKAMVDTEDNTPNKGCKILGESWIQGCARLLNIQKKSLGANAKRSRGY